MNFEISIEDKAKKFLEKKGNILKISRMDIVRCCAAYEDLDVSYKKPKNENYEKHQCDDLTIYIQKGLQFKHNCVEIALSGAGPFKTIAIGNLKRLI